MEPWSSWHSCSSHAVGSDVPCVAAGKGGLVGWDWQDGAVLTGHQVRFRLAPVWAAGLEACVWFVRWCVSIGSVLHVMNQFQIQTILKHSPSYVYFTCVVHKQRRKGCIGDEKRTAFSDSRVCVNPMPSYPRRI